MCPKSVGRKIKMIEDPILAGSSCCRLLWHHNRIVDVRLALGNSAANEDIPAEAEKDEERHEEEAEAEYEHDPVGNVCGVPGKSEVTFVGPLHPLPQDLLAIIVRNKIDVLRFHTLTSKARRNRET